LTTYIRDDDIIIFRNNDPSERGLTDSQMQEITVESFKQQLLQLSDSGITWEDLRVPASAVQVKGQQGTDPPAWSLMYQNSVYGANYGGLWTYKFAGGANTWQDVHFQAQIPHAYYIGSDLHPHVHVVFSGGSAGQKLLLEWEYAWLNINEAYIDSTIYTFNHIITADNLANVHIIISLPTMVKENATLSSMVSGIFSRIVKNPSWTFPDLTGGGLDNDNYGGSLFFLEFDFHYQSDSAGSENEFEKHGESIL